MRKNVTKERNEKCLWHKSIYIILYNYKIAIYI